MGRFLSNTVHERMSGVLPGCAVLSLTESSPRHATLGKRAVGLVVTDAGARRAGPGRIWARNLIKALPWQIAHIGVSRSIRQVQTPFAVACSSAGSALALACAVPSLAGHRGLHDLLAGTRVHRSR